MGKKIMVFLMVGSMVFSTVGIGLVIWLSGQSSTATTSQQEPIFDELGIIDIVEGDGEAVDDVSDVVTVDYRGTLASNGEEFDSSYERGEPISFELTGVIDGWTQGLIGMKVGGTRQLEIPSSLAYGVAGSGTSIPPNSDLIFEIELIAIENAEVVEDVDSDAATEESEQ